MWTTIVIDDERLARQRIKRLLAVYNEVNIIAEAENGAEGLALIEKHHPDLIFLDHWMRTKSSGGELCLMIKENEATKDIPVILISVVNNIGQIAMDSCSDGCLTKPFEIEEIESVVNAYIG